jgi:cell division protein FtsQ
MRKKNRTSPIKNILKSLPVLVGVLAIFYLAMQLRDVEVPTMLAVENIHVDGELYFLDAEQIRKTVIDNTLDGYFAMDLKNIREVLLKQPWVKDVSLRRQWPADVTVFVEERKPVAYWNDDALIDSAGNVFKPTSFDKALALPRLRGPESLHPKVLKFMNALYKAMHTLNYDVQRLELDDRRAWNLAIQSMDEQPQGKKVAGIDVKLGRYQTEKRLQRFIQILPALSARMKQSETAIRVIDMRYPNGFAVQWLGVEKIAVETLDTEKLALLMRTGVSTNKKSIFNNMTHDSVRGNTIATGQMSEV